MAGEITFVVPGVALPPGQLSSAVNDRGTVKAAVRVGARRGAGEAVSISAQPGEDIVLLHIANGPTLYLHPQDAAELLRAQTSGKAGLNRGGAAPPSAGGAINVPSQLKWQTVDPGTNTRSGLKDWVGDVVLDTVEVVTGFFKDRAAAFAAAEVTKALDGQVNPGVYRLGSEGNLASLKKETPEDKIPAPDNPTDPILVLVHGTFVDTASTFGKLWAQHRSRVDALFKFYGDRVYALDHPTVGVSPFGNALTLVRTLPKNAHLHLVTHSRGGLVAEAIARICGGQGLTDADRALFKGDAYKQHRIELDQLAKEIAEHGVKVDRLVRVACPARGTLLASKRLDAYLSVLKWGLELAGIPVVPQLVDFVTEVARRRAQPDELPGLEAMIPDKPFAQWLNAPAEPIPGDLRVVAGDIEGDSVLSWLKTLLSDAFYWTDNDLVVQTRSMYGGTPRQEGQASFVLDRGGQVMHFNYFSNKRTADLITRALQGDATDFHIIGPLSWAGEDPSGTRSARAARRSQEGDPATRPAVFVLPGILGSHIKVDGKRIWLSLRFVNNLDRLRWDPNTVGRVESDGPVGMSYDDLIEFLADSHEVIPFSFDWRRPIEDEARRLADAVDKALAVRASTQQPVRIVAHSMGGLVARTMRLERLQTWNRMMSRPGARLLMLGTPNGGSFAPMQVLSGDDTFGNYLSAFGSLFDERKARQLIAGMPGLMQLQAGLVNGDHGLDTVAGWQKLSDDDVAAAKLRVENESWWHNTTTQLDALNWGVPTQDVLDKAVALRKRLDEQRGELGADVAKMLLVVGKAPFTPTDVKSTGDGVVYLDSPDGGDGRVTFERACLPGVKTWRVDVAHGDLADERKAFDAYVELLANGDTARLPVAFAARSGMRGAGDAQTAPVPVESRPARSPRGAEPPSTQSDVFALAGSAPTTKPGARLQVAVVNGNLRLVRQPLMLGHYRSFKLTGTEYAINNLLNRSLAESLQAGLYPTLIGSNQVFVNTRRNPDDPFVLPRPEAAIVVGLGEEGSLRLANLSETVRQAVLAYAQRISERDGGSSTFELATTVMGSGGSDMSVGTAIQAIAAGVQEANRRLALVKWPQVARLTFIELYLDRATEAMQALRSLSDAGGSLVVDPFIRPGLGALVRPPEAGYRGADYDFISVQRHGGDKAPLEFSLDTRRARSEVRGVVTQTKLVDELVAAGASDTSVDERIGRSLFQLLVPLELEPFLAGSAAMVMRLDVEAARYPWELLDNPRSAREGVGDDRPWAVRTRLLRKLQIDDFREHPRDTGSEDSVLVIGEPQCPPNRYPPLPGAAAEAGAVAEVLGVKPLINGNALSIVNEVLARPYRILHVAGHGDIVQGIGGIVLSGGTTFGPTEIEAMRSVPELAFINCCHLGAFPAEPLAKVNRLGSGLPGFAANVAGELIRIGVRCVIAAGWAVDDAAAMAFARRFYSDLKKGLTFIEAVGNAREEIWRKFPKSNTWAAYQCYGDPDWTYRSSDDKSSGPARAQADIASSRGLVLRLEGLASKHKYDKKAKEGVREQVEQLRSLYAAQWGNQGDVAAAFGAVYGEIEDLPAAIEWYERAIKAEDGGLSLKAMEQLGNLQARLAPRNADTSQARKKLNEAIALLEQINAMAPTVERESLLGSAYKRLADVEKKSAHGARKAGAKPGYRAVQKAEEAALHESIEHYANAERIACERSADNLFYPAMNRLALSLRLSFRSGAAREFKREDLAVIRQSLKQKVTNDPDFWSVVGLTELRIYEALAESGLAKALPGVLADLDDLLPRATSSLMWASVADQHQALLGEYIATKPAREEVAAANKLLERLRASTAKPASKAEAQAKDGAAKGAAAGHAKPTANKARKRAGKRR